MLTFLLNGEYKHIWGTERQTSEQICNQDPKQRVSSGSEDSESLLDFPYRCHMQIYKSPWCLMSQLRFCLICFIHLGSHWFMPAALDACQRSFITIRAHQKNADILGMVAGIDGTQLPIPPGTKIVLACKSRGGGVWVQCHHWSQAFWDPDLKKVLSPLLVLLLNIPNPYFPCSQNWYKELASV